MSFQIFLLNDEYLLVIEGITFYLIYILYWNFVSFIVSLLTTFPVNI